MGSGHWKRAATLVRLSYLHNLAVEKDSPADHHHKQTISYLTTPSRDTAPLGPLKFRIWAPFTSFRPGQFKNVPTVLLVLSIPKEIEISGP